MLKHAKLEAWIWELKNIKVSIMLLHWVAMAVVVVNNFLSWINETVWHILPVTSSPPEQWSLQWCYYLGHSKNVSWWRRRWWWFHARRNDSATLIDEHLHDEFGNFALVELFLSIVLVRADRLLRRAHVPAVQNDVYVRLGTGASNVTCVRGYLVRNTCNMNTIIIISSSSSSSIIILNITSIEDFGSKSIT